MAGTKRARAAAFSEHERYVHKSGVVLQREGKKIRAFLVRKAVAQLKQTREQHAQAERALEGPDLDEKKRKRAQGKVTKLFHTVAKLERELAALKVLDLKAVVAGAFEKTGLRVEEPVEEESEEEDEPRMSAHDREMAKYGRGRVVDEHSAKEDDDDGFNSEDYDEAPRSDGSDSDDGEEEEEEEEDDGSENENDGGSGDDSEEEEEEEENEDDVEQDEELQVVQAEEVAEGDVLFGPMGPPGGDMSATSAVPEKTPEDEAMTKQLVDRVLSHNQMQPFLDAIRQYVEKKERDAAKKRRQKEKSALKRARASMVGGRSSAAPTSMFFGSLSGDAPDDDMDTGMGGVGRASMAGAEDDIAEFLGETKKKKNRPGQMARRQKAIRLEEARRAAQEGDAGGFQKRRFQSRDAPSVGKYGPSERPKKQQKKDGPAARGSKQRDGERPASRQDNKRGDRDFSDKRHDRRGRDEVPRAAVPQQAAKKPAPQRKPEIEPSHPSWLAKQAMKEKQKVDINAFSGKKITFGDD